LKIEDSQKIKLLFYPYDNRNLINICLQKKVEWHPLGNYKKDQLLQYLNESSNEIPEYLNIFYDEYMKGILPDEEFVLQNVIATRFYDFVLPRTDGFIYQWLSFNRDFRNILVAMSARQNGYQLENQFIGNNSIVTKLKTDTSFNFGLQTDFPKIDQLIQMSEDHQILGMEKQIDFIRWSKIDEISQFAGFSFDAVAAFMAKLILVHRWTNLDLEKGKKVIENKMNKINERINSTKEMFL
jgi:hypothetical protein